MAEAPLVAPQDDPSFMSASPEDRHAYLSATDKSYASASPEDQRAYLQHLVVEGAKQNIANYPASDVAPKGPGMLDTANQFYASDPNASTSTKIGKGLGRVATMPANVGHALVAPPTDEEKKQGFGMASMAGPLQVNRLIVDPSVRAAEHVEQMAAAQRARDEAAGHPNRFSTRAAELGGKTLAMVPILGPMALGMGEQAAKGDVAGTVAEALGYSVLPGIKEEASPGGQLPGAPKAGEPAYPMTRNIVQRGIRAAAPVVEKATTPAALGTLAGGGAARMVGMNPAEGAAIGGGLTSLLTDKAKQTLIPKTVARMRNYGLEKPTYPGAPLPEAPAASLGKVPTPAAEPEGVTGKELAGPPEEKPVHEQNIEALQKNYDAAYAEYQKHLQNISKFQASTAQGIEPPAKDMKAYEKAHQALIEAEMHLDLAKEAAEKAGKPPLANPELTNAPTVRGGQTELPGGGTMGKPLQLPAAPEPPKVAEPPQGEVLPPEDPHANVQAIRAKMTPAKMQAGMYDQPVEAAPAPEAPVTEKPRMQQVGETAEQVKKIGDLTREGLGGTELKPNVPLKEQVPAQPPVEEKISSRPDKAVLQRAKASPETMEKLLKLGNVELRQLAINAGEDMGQESIGRDKGKVGTPREQIFERLLKNHSVEDLGKMVDDGKHLPSVSGGSQAADVVGTQEGADRDTKLFAEARAKLGPDASLSDVAQEAQRMKTAPETKENPVAKDLESYNKSIGKPKPDTTKVVKDPRAVEVADAYEAMKHDPDNPQVKKAYNAFKTETKAQWEHLKDQGYTIDLSEKDPYSSYEDMAKDVKDNKHISVYDGKESHPPADHPMSEIDPETGLTYNSLFRAVHDIMGHAAGDNDFSERGEENAYNLHRQAYSDRAVPALTTETKGQTSAYFNNKAVREGKAEPGFPEQKANLLPKETYENGPQQIDAAKAKEVVDHIKSGKDYAVLQAENPQNERVSDAKNAELTNKLFKELKEKGYKPVAVGGNTKDVEGTTEHAFFVPDIKPEDAVKIAKDYDQWGIITNKGLHELGTGVINPIKEGEAIKTGDAARGEQYYTTVGNEDFNVPVDFSKSVNMKGAPLDEFGNPIVSGGSQAVDKGKSSFNNPEELSEVAKSDSSTIIVMPDGRVNSFSQYNPSDEQYTHSSNFNDLLHGAGGYHEEDSSYLNELDNLNYSKFLEDGGIRAAAENPTRAFANIESIKPETISRALETLDTLGRKESTFEFSSPDSGDKYHEYRKSFDKEMSDYNEKYGTFHYQGGGGYYSYEKGSPAKPTTPLGYHSWMEKMSKEGDPVSFIATGTPEEVRSSVEKWMKRGMTGTEHAPGIEGRFMGGGEGPEYPELKPEYTKAGQKPPQASMKTAHMSDAELEKAGFTKEQIENGEHLPTVSGGSMSRAEAEKLAEKHLEEGEQFGNKSGRANFIKNLMKMPSVQEVVDIAKAGEVGKEWYQRSTKAFDALMKNAPRYFQEADREKFINFLAALSPQQSVKMNLQEALSTWTKYVDMGRPEGKPLENMLKGELTVQGAKVGNAMKALAGESQWPDLSGNRNFKVPSFGENLRGFLNRVTNDGWQAAFAGILPEKMQTASQYHPLSVVTRAAAEALGWEPAEAQAAIWAFTKMLTEHGETLPEDVLKYSEDFADLMAHDKDIRSQLEELGVPLGELDEHLKQIQQKPEVTGGASPTTEDSIGKLRSRLEKLGRDIPRAKDSGLFEQSDAAAKNAFFKPREEGTDFNPENEEPVKAVKGAPRDEFGNPTVSGGSQAATAPAKAPITQKLIAKYGTTDNAMAPAQFIDSEGNRIPVQDHDRAVAAVMDKKVNPDDRIGYMNNEKAVRVRFRSGQAGKEVVFSIPDKVTPEQIKQMEKTVAGLGQFGTMHVEQAQHGGNYTSRVNAKSDMVRDAVNQVNRPAKMSSYPTQMRDFRQ